MNRRRKISFIRKVKQHLTSSIGQLALLVLGILLVTSTTIGISIHGTSAQSTDNVADSSNPGGIDPITQAYAGFQGKIGRTLAESTPWWPQPAVASQGPLNHPPLGPPSIVATAPPPGAPNIVVFLIDDMGFADLGPFGSEINTPNIDKLAVNGLRFNNYTTLPLCSPTRAALLTGLNSHSAGVGYVAEGNPGFPGYAGEIQDNVVTLAEILRSNGYATLMTGKWHLTQTYDRVPEGPFNSWPLQRGFERFVGFLDGWEHPQTPQVVYDGNYPLNLDQYPQNFLTTDYWTERAIELIDKVKTNNSDKPFFLYFANNAVHNPHNVHPEDLAKYKGKYDAGWDQLRWQRYQQQLASGIIPQETKLPPPNPGVKAWDELSDADKQLFARYQEVYAAFVDNIDQNFGKLYQYLEKTGQLDNTIIIVTADNGGSGEGGLEGSSNMPRFYSGLSEDKELSFSRLDLIGSPQTFPIYPTGWTTVSNTPFRLYKGTTNGGGRREPFIISWPARIKDQGAIRTQFTHVSDITPTLLEVTGLEHPETFNGKKTKPLEGTSFAYLLNDANAPEQHTEQYFEMSGRRGYYKDGWYILTEHQPGTPIADSEWQLYNLKQDYSETNNLANQYPDKVQELAAAFDIAAFKYQVYPLIDNLGQAVLSPLLPTFLKQRIEPSTAKTFYPGKTVLFPDILPLVADRDYTIKTNFQYKQGDRGVILAHGGQEAGYVFYIEDGELAYEYNGFGRLIKFPRVKIQPGKLNVELDFKATGKRQGFGTLLLNGTKVAEGQLGPTFYFVPYDGLDIGKDAHSPVSWDVYQKYGVFKYSGKIEQVTYIPGSYAPN